jgi:hypothetical protein
VLAAVGVDARLALAALLCAAGCGRTAEPAPPPQFPPSESIPVAPLGPAPSASVEPTGAASAAPLAASQGAAPLPPLPEGGLAAAEDAGAPPDVALSPSRPPHVLLVDEPPFSPAFLHGTQPTSHGKHRGRRGKPYHAAPRIVVDVTEGDASGDLQRTARNLGYWPFRGCYEEGLRRDGQLAGKVALRVLVAPGGAVERSQAMPSSLVDPVVVACVGREARRLAFPAAPGERDAVFEVTLGTGDEPVFAPPPLANAGPLREALRGSWSAVERCYADRLAKAADVGGRMELHFRVQSSGAVSEVAEGEPRFGDVDVTRCVLGVYRTSHLPVEGSPRRRRSSDFVYALHFEAGDAPSVADAR